MRMQCVSSPSDMWWSPSASHAVGFDATLHAFVNDNSLARDYFDKLENWLIETNQVDADAVSDAAPYWTNEIAL